MSNLATGTLLKKLRIDNGYTIQQIAYKLGVSKPAVSKWENGEYITTEHLYELAKFYGVSVAELLAGKRNDESNSDFWRRNYDLSNYELQEDINNNNVEKVNELFAHYKMVKKRFFELLPKWAANNLGTNEKDEFDFIKQYFKFDNRDKSLLVKFQFIFPRSMAECIGNFL